MKRWQRFALSVLCPSVILMLFFILWTPHGFELPNMFKTSGTEKRPIKLSYTSGEKKLELELWSGGNSLGRWPFFALQIDGRNHFCTPVTPKLEQASGLYLKTVKGKGINVEPREVGGAAHLCTE